MSDPDGWTTRDERFLRRINKAETAIKRVRAIAPKDPDRPGWLGVQYRLGYNDALRDVLRALDGDQ